jgi:hypothetical protein
LKTLIRLIADAAAGLSIPVAAEPEVLTWRLLRALRVRELHLEGSDQVEITTALNTLIVLDVDHDATRAEAVLGKLERLTGSWVPSAATVTPQMLLTELSGYPLRTPHHTPRLPANTSPAALAMAPPDTSRLPPHVRDLLQDEPTLTAALWPLLGQFVSDQVDPHALAAQWATVPPPGVERFGPVALLVVGELLNSYRQYDGAVRHWNEALNLGVYPRAPLLLQVARTLHDTKPNGSDWQAPLDELAKTTPDYPPHKAWIAIIACRWAEAIDHLQRWTGPSPREREQAAMFLATALYGADELDEAVNTLLVIAPDAAAAGPALQLSRLLRIRAWKGTGDNRHSDGHSAVEWAIRGRDLRRIWRGDSAEAVVVAAEAAFTIRAPELVWKLVRPAPEGEALESEYTNKQVIPIAALTAAMTQRITEAHRLLDGCPDGYARARTEAEIASVTDPDGTDSDLVTKWRQALSLAPTDEDRLAESIGHSDNLI